ncbi:MAG TPA: enolase C-terminal domain-like protein [Candidatus Paceibacterota bacterium]|nr:enolase C-terminal domain-like protein [Candidatus Paceibacterota bacterium]
MDKKITNIKADQILDSRNNPTLKVSVYVDEVVGVFEVPSGASTGKYEACELRDGEGGKSGVMNAVNKIEEIIKPALIGVDVDKQKEIDEIMLKLDGTKQKTNLGGNSMIGVSIACAKAAARLLGMEVFQYLKTITKMNPSREEPYLYFNLINGGKHAHTKLAFQEFHIVPQVETSKESVEISRNIQTKLDAILEQEFGAITKGDEGGIALDVEDIFTPLKLINRAVEELGYSDKIKYALDVAASSFYDTNSSMYKFMNKDWTKEEMINLYEKICSEFKMISIEDPFDEEDYESFAILQSKIGETRLIGDDLTVTNIERLGKAIEMKSIKGIIIKPNQIGTLSETLDTMRLARENNIDCIISHRSGETMDDFIGDLSVAFGCFGIKAGALGPRERNIKYERIIKITTK